MHIEIEKLKKPKRPYKNFEDFCTSITRFTTNDKRIMYPCLTCGGRSRIIDPTELPDPVEGHKFSRRIDCPKCKGTGKTDRKTSMDAYKKEMATYKRSMIGYRKMANDLKRGISKLSEDELVALKSAILGWDYY